MHLEKDYALGLKLQAYFCVFFYYPNTKCRKSNDSITVELQF